MYGVWVSYHFTRKNTNSFILRDIYILFDPSLKCQRCKNINVSLLVVISWEPYDRIKAEHRSNLYGIQAYELRVRVLTPSSLWCSIFYLTLCLRGLSTLLKWYQIDCWEVGGRCHIHHISHRVEIDVRYIV